MIRHHAHTPARVISLLYGADVNGLTELRAAVTLITASTESKSQAAHKHAHVRGKPELANLSRGGTHGNVKAQLRKPDKRHFFRIILIVVVVVVVVVAGESAD